MAGYSGTPLTRKLGLQPGMTVLFVAARGISLAHGLVDVKVCAVDEIWSGLKFVRRVKDRA